MNDVNNDLKIIIDALDIDDKVLSDFAFNYRIIRKEKPEAIYIICQQYKALLKEKRRFNRNTVITVEEIKEKLKSLKKSFEYMLCHIDEDLTLIESNRIVKNELIIKKPKEKGKRAIWLGTKEQLLELFFRLKIEGFTVYYDEYVILGHFKVLANDESIYEGKALYPHSEFFWMGTDDSFVQLINELVEKGFFPKGNKYKNLIEHFLNSREEPFKYLGQKKYFNNNFSKENKKIKEIVEFIFNLQ